MAAVAREVSAALGLSVTPLPYSVLYEHTVDSTKARLGGSRGGKERAREVFRRERENGLSFFFTRVFGVAKVRAGEATAGKEGKRKERRRRERGKS